MKKILIFICFLIAGISLVIFVFLRNSSTNNSLPAASPTPTISITPDVTPFCFESNIIASVDSEIKAESKYLKLRIKNNAGVSCQIQSDNILEIKVEGYPKNVNQEIKVSPEQYLITLSPQSEAYAQLSVPNGQNCTTSISRELDIQYQLSQDERVKFKSSQQKPSIQVCANEKEITTIDIWSWSQEPIVQ